jgi:ABC-2 type transport system ATP-binding protein
MADGIAKGNIIETSGLIKRYGSLKAVDQVSLSVKKSEIYGFLGLNGAGKTTTIRMILGMVHPDSGRVSICGSRITRGRVGPWQKVGYLVELPFSYPELTVRENLLAVSRLRGLNGSVHADEIINRMQLNAYSHVKARNLSLGNNQRLGLAKALIHKPEVLILDEPSNGLDPAGIVEIRELLKEIAFNRGVTVFISSHNLSEISRLATRIGIIHQGALVQEIDADKLDSVLHKTLLLDTRDRIGTVSFLIQRGFKVEYADNGMIRIPDPEACQKPEEINGLLVRAGFAPCHLSAAQEDLESYFLRIIGEKAC